MAAGEVMWMLAAAMSGTVVLESWWFRPRWEVGAEPLGVGPVVRVDTRGPVNFTDLSRQIATART